MPPDVLVVTVTLPVSWVQVMENAASTEPPSGTVTVCDGPFATVQFPATPARKTVWLPAATGVTVMVWFTPIGCGVPLSTAKV